MSSIQRFRGQVPTAEGPAYNAEERRMAGRYFALFFLPFYLLLRPPPERFLLVLGWLVASVGSAFLLIAIRKLFARTRVGPDGICEILWLEKRLCPWSRIQDLELHPLEGEGSQVIVHRRDGREMLFRSRSAELDRALERVWELLDHARGGRAERTRPWPPRAQGPALPLSLRMGLLLIPGLLLPFLIGMWLMYPDTPNGVPLGIFAIFLVGFAVHVLFVRTIVDGKGIREVSPVYRRGCRYDQIEAATAVRRPTGGSVLHVTSRNQERQFYSASPRLDEAFRCIAERFGPV